MRGGFGMTEKKIAGPEEMAERAAGLFQARMH